jgi:nuclear cap-binding protein subunit 2
MSIVPSLGQPSSYRDRKYPLGLAQLELDLGTSKTLYVGNLSFYTTEEQLVEVFGRVGEVRRVVMG